MKAHQLISILEADPDGDVLMETDNYMLPIALCQYDPLDKTFNFIPSDDWDDTEAPSDDDDGLWDVEKGDACKLPEQDDGVSTMPPEIKEAV